MHGDSGGSDGDRRRRRRMGNCASGSLYAGKNGRTLDQYLAEAVFQDSEISVLNPEEEGVAGYRSFMERYTKRAFDRNAQQWKTCK